MLRSIFPKAFDNNYVGQRLALWLLAPILFLKLGIGVNSIINARHVAASADSIALDRFTSEAAQTVVSLFAIGGLTDLLPALLGVIVLVRYRAMVPLIYLMFLVERIGTKALILLYPIARSNTQTVAVGGISMGSVVSLGLIAAIAVGFVLSLVPRSTPRSASPSTAP